MAESSQQVVISVRGENSPQFVCPSIETNCFEGRLKHVMYLGTHVHCMVELLSGDNQSCSPTQLGAARSPHTVYAVGSNGLSGSDTLVLLREKL